MPSDLGRRYPGVRHFMATILLGGGTLEQELVDYVQGVSGDEVVRSTITEIRSLLADPDVTDHAIDTFVLDNAHRFVAGSGRRTLEHVADRLHQLLDDPPAPHPLTLRAPTLAAFLTQFTRQRGDLDALVRAGAVAAGADVVARSAEEGAALLQDAELTDRDLATFVRSHSWWLLEDSGRRTVEQVVAVLRRPAGPLGHDVAKVLAEMHLDRVVRAAHEGEIVIVDQHTQESATTWAFVYNSRDYVETGSFLDMLVGNGPVLVDKATGRTRAGRSDLSVAEQIGPGMNRPMPDALAARFPEVVYLLSAYVLGDDTLPDEMNQYSATETTERALGVLDDLNELLSDATVTGDQLDAFARTHTSRWYGSGQATLEHVGEALMRVMEARAALRPADDPTSPPRHVRDRLTAWLRAQGLIPPDDFTDWTVVDAGMERWVLTPPGFAGVILVVTPSTIRAIRPAVESVPDALRELGIS